MARNLTKLFKKFNLPTDNEKEYFVEYTSEGYIVYSKTNGERFDIILPNSPSQPVAELLYKLHATDDLTPEQVSEKLAEIDSL